MEAGKRERAPNGSPELRRYSSATKSPTITHRVRGGLYEKLKAEAEKNGLSLSEEIERRLGRSFDLEEQIAVRDRYMAAAEREERLLWPDKGARAFGNAVAMALSAVRYTGGKDWRDDDAVPAIMAGVVRRIVDHCNRTRGASSTVSELVHPQRIASTIETVSTSLATYLDGALPALSPLQPQDDPANWTGCARGAVVFRDRATGDLVEVVQGAEYDIAEHEIGAEFPAECSAAIVRYTPQRDAMDVETFNVYPLKDRSAAWHSLSRPGRVFVVPEGQGAPPAFEPALTTTQPTADSSPAAELPPSNSTPADEAQPEPTPKRRGRPRKNPEA